VSYLICGQAVRVPAQHVQAQPAQGVRSALDMIRGLD
jgi:hypothetical protein